MARHTSATYRRRRAAFALAAIAAVVLVLFIVIGGGSGGGGESAAEEKPVELTVSVSGDLLIHSPVFFRAQALAGGAGYDFKPTLAPLEPYVKKADLAICHFETPVSDIVPPSGLPTFNAPPELADAVVATGWDICDTASNHSTDQGQEGVAATVELLDRVGIGHTGSYASARAQAEPLIVKAKGVRVGLVAYTTGSNGLVPEPYSLNVASEPDEVLEDARAARAAGAEVVLVNMHWFSETVAEYSTEPSEEQVEFAEALVAAPEVTAVVGQGPHVVQPIEWIDDKPVVFSEGNLLANQGAAAGLVEASQDGIVALLDIESSADGARVRRVRYVPVYVSQPDFTVLPVGAGIESGAADEAALRASYERTVDVIGRDRRTKPIPPKLP
jgi:poly-gamma-glutamate synthesis protein (capsule biosynthesis protein)